MLARFRDGALERQDQRAGIVAWTGCPPACLGCAGPGRVREAWPGGVSAFSEKQAFFAPSLGVRTCHRPRKRQRVYLCFVNVCKLWCLCAGDARKESRHSRTHFFWGGGGWLCPGLVKAAWPGGVSASSEKQTVTALSPGVRTCLRPRPKHRVPLCRRHGPAAAPFLKSKRSLRSAPGSKPVFAQGQSSVCPERVMDCRSSAMLQKAPPTALDPGVRTCHPPRPECR